MVWKCCLAPAARVSFKSLGGQAAFRCPTLVQKSAGMATRARARFQTVSPKRRTLKEIVMAPAGDGAFNMGKGVLAGASAFGVGALCYYGLGMSNESGALEKSMYVQPLPVASVPLSFHLCIQKYVPFLRSRIDASTIFSG